MTFDSQWWEISFLMIGVLFSHGVSVICWDGVVFGYYDEDYGVSRPIIDLLNCVGFVDVTIWLSEVVIKENNDACACS